MRFKKKIFQDKGLFYKTMIDLFDKKMPIEYAEKIELVKRKFNHEQERFLEVKKKLVKRLAGKVNDNPELYDFDSKEKEKKFRERLETVMEQDVIIDVEIEFSKSKLNFFQVMFSANELAVLKENFVFKN